MKKKLTFFLKHLEVLDVSSVHLVVHTRQPFKLQNFKSSHAHLFICHLEQLTHELYKGRCHRTVIFAQ